MTTIAWDGTTLAADRRISNNGMTRAGQKVWELHDGRLFATCGNVEDGLAALRWLECGGDLPTLDEDTFAGIIVRGGSAFRVESKMIESKILETTHAMGSGRDFAIAAMHLGMTAREAVEIAALFDTGTGHGVDDMRWGAS